MSAQPAAPAVPPDHVTIEIDGASMVVPKGSMIITAADKAGIAIPRFCWHEKLPIAANCRMCMVEVEMGGKPMPKPQPACATPVADGMKIQTQSAKALSAQRNVMEFLLINHPLDCPICDQGGECELQDLAVGYGRSVSRFVERKRTIPDEDIGPLVETEMTRCIQCTRCVRFMADIAGTYELGGMERGERLQIGTYVGKPLMSELSGNVIDVCPVGALTNKPFRFRARAWELLARESIGYHDALGSNLWLHVRRGEALRAVPRDNEAINECWLSDRDRYSCEGLLAPDRSRKPQVKRNGAWVDVDWNDAIRAASEALRETPRGDIGALLSPATSSEEGHLVAKLVRALGSEHIDHRLRQQDFGGQASPLAWQMPVAAIEKADVIVLVGCNPRHEMPLLGARIRKATKHGAKIFAINPVDFDFDFEFALAAKRIVAPDAFADAVLAAARAANTVDGESSADDFGKALLEALGAASAGVVILGEAALQHPQAAQIRASANHLARATQSACNEIPCGANALGLARVGALPGDDGLDARAMLAAPKHAYVLYGCEPPADFADGAAAMAALGKATHVIAFAAFASEALKKVASVILPIGLLPEIDATLVNVDGVAQVTLAAAKPPGEARPGWKVLRALGSALSLDGFGFTEIGEVRVQMAAPAVSGSLASGGVGTASVGAASVGAASAAMLSQLDSPTIAAEAAPTTAAMLSQLDSPTIAAEAAPTTAAMLSQLDGPTIAAEAAPTTSLTGSTAQPATAPRALQRIATTAIYSGDAVLRRSAALQAHPTARTACVVLHPEDAMALGLGHAAIARVDGVDLPVELSPRVPRGGAWIEAGHAVTATLPPYGAPLDIVKA